MSNLSHLTRAKLERHVQTLEAELVLRNQDVKGCEDMFEALNVPERRDGTRLRPTGRANLLLTRYRSLHGLASDAVGDLPAGGEHTQGYLDRLEDLAPEAP